MLIGIMLIGGGECNDYNYDSYNTFIKKTYKPQLIFVYNDESTGVDLMYMVATCPYKCKPKCELKYDFAI